MLRRALASVAVVAMLALCGLVVAAGPASAHAALTSSDPSDGVTLSALPQQVQLTFDESVGAPAYVTVTGPDGSTVASGEATVDGATVTQVIPAGAGAAGAYAVAYRVISDDGHPVTGQLTFSVGADGVAPDSPQAGAAASPSQKSFVERHIDHFVVGGVLLLAAFGLLALSRRRE